MYILLCGTNQKNVLQKEIKDLIFEILDPSSHLLKKFFPIRDQIFMTSTQRGGWEVLKSVMCL